MQTALAALGVCGIMQGVFYLSLGAMRGSELVQYLPYPVVCGLLGSTGLNIMQARHLPISPPPSMAFADLRRLSVLNIMQSALLVTTRHGEATTFAGDFP